ncbi:DUF4352 domain-containing protein [Micropruina sp.]|uniref:DUF4352 domain-containing protein n=1 Tax=Micropruina sp. TaxID=2737536 RepID=UPI0039E71681
MDSSNGLGRPGSDAPDFDGPASNPPAPPATQQYPAQPYGQGAYPPPAQTGYPPPTQTGWAPPGQPPYAPGGYPPPAQTGQRPPGRPGGVRGFVLAGAVIVVLIGGLLAWQFLGPQASPPAAASASASAQPSPSGSTEPTVVRASPTAQPTTSTPVTGGGIGKAVDFNTNGGSARVTLTGANWADNGVISPDDGESYLIVDLTFVGVSGTVTTGPFFTAITDSRGESQMMTIGAALSHQLPMRTLTAGQTNTGQVAFAVPRGAVTFQVLDELLDPVVTVDLPG